MGNQYKGTTLEGRFWAKIKKAGPDECWEWDGAITKTGYGNLFNGAGAWEYAHRISYRLHRGDIPVGALVCHACDNRKCVNPAHLWLGSAKDNTQDMVRKGRAKGGAPLGARHHRAKLDDMKVALIKARLARGEQQNKLATEFGVTTQSIHAIKHGRSWKSVVAA